MMEKKYYESVKTEKNEGIIYHIMEDQPKITYVVSLPLNLNV